MKIVSSPTELGRALDSAPFVATMGFFDGVHAGHRKLLSELSFEARYRGEKSVILALDRPWSVAVHPDAPHPKLLCSLQKKVELLMKESSDILFLIPFTREVAEQDMVSFVMPLLSLGMSGMVLGYDNRFGKKENRLSIEDFDRLLRSLGLNVRRIPQLFSSGVPVSSSLIREKVRFGDFEAVESLLGRPFSLIGNVDSGRQIGRTIAYPTANIVPIEPDVILPEDGVFVSEVRVDDQIYPAMSYYGPSPTVAGWDALPRIEAYLFGFHGNLYGKQAEIAYRHRLRDDRAFASLDELKAQLMRDEAETRTFFSTHPLRLL